MAELNYASSYDSMDSVLSGMTTSISSMSSVNLNGTLTSPCYQVNPMEIKQRTKLKKDALEFVDFIKEYQNDPKYKTELCKTWSESGFCAYGNKCRFAHGKHELFDKVINCKKYKQKECMSFFKTSYCCYGSRCHFRHQERKISEMPRSYHGLLLRNLETLSENQIKNLNGETLLLLIQSNPGLHTKRRLAGFSEICNPKISKSNRYLKSIENFKEKNQHNFTLNLYNTLPMF